MQHDDLLWQVFKGRCIFKVKTVKQNFCKNEYNVSGLCNRSSCPLANSQYATIKEEEARCYLYMKTVETAHTPKNMWTKVKLSKNYQKALAQIDDHLMYWPKNLIHKNKQRLTKIVQYLIRIKKLSAQVRPKIVPIRRKEEKQEKTREAKAEIAARLDNAIEAELLKRLQSGTYGDIYNFPMEQYNKVLEREVRAAVDEEEVEADLYEDSEEEEEFEEDEEEEEEEEIEYLDGDAVEISDDDIEDVYSDDSELEELSSSGDDDDDDDGEAPMEKPKRPRAGEKPSKKKRRKHMELEYEEEIDTVPTSR
ncbi:hypothetical protein BSKO_06835 [Bryopsis sp. KO-2023]|nr:hypothetical protein BSKO_06835 [Bryopsis sp. KO-2023]